MSDWSASTRRRRTASAISAAWPTQAPAGHVDGVVDVADDDGDEGVEPGQQRPLGRRLHGAEQHLRIAQHLLEVGQVAGVGRVEGGELVAEGVGVGLEAGHVRRQQRLELGAHVGDVSTAWLASSCRQTHSRMSSAGRLQSSPKRSTVALTT